MEFEALITGIQELCKGPRMVVGSMKGIYNLIIIKIYSSYAILRTNKNLAV